MPGDGNGMSNLVEISNLNIRFTGERTVYAVNDLSLTLGEGEVLGLLGESGSGKSVTLRALMRLLPKKRTQIAVSVQVLGRDVLALDEEKLSAFRDQTVSMIFQEPALALDPVYTIGQQIAESVMRHEGKGQADALARALEMLEVVRIPSAKRRLDAYPHEMSGGMRQRAMIALALACKPKILLADEPTTALDATVQIQILLLLRELQREFGMSVIFVTHDIGVAIEICDRVAVMYAGQIVEQGTLSQIVRTPIHPYARGLLASTVHGANRGQRLETIPGTPASRSRAASSNCRPMWRWGRTESHDAFWRCQAFRRSLQQPSPLRRAAPSLGAQPGVGPFLDLGGADNLFGLMRVERPGAHRPALGQYLHCAQLGVDFRLERSRRPDWHVRAVVRFHRFLRAKGHIPDVRLCHGNLTPMVAKSFIFLPQSGIGGGAGSCPRGEGGASRTLCGGGLLKPVADRKLPRCGRPSAVSTRRRPISPRFIELPQ